MRSDMAKVIVERPRHGARGTFPLRARPDSDRLSIEDWRSRESIRRPWSAHRKNLNENLAPLQRFLRSRVGKKWDNVYSEICEHINRDSAVQLHIWQHLIEYVCTDPYVIAGDVRYRRRTYFYIVDPRTGELRENPDCRWRRSRGPSKPDPNVVAISNVRQYRRINGIWFELQLADVPLNRVGYDYGIKSALRSISDEQLHEFYGRAVFACAKRQLNKHELRRLGLTPEPTAQG